MNVDLSVLNKSLSQSPYQHRCQYRRLAGTGLLTTVLLLAGCASSHDLKEGDNFWGGGYLVEEESAGVFRITAKTNWAQWSSYDTARRMWEKHATEACGGNSYVEKDIREYDYEAAPQYQWAKYIVTVKEGLAVCGKGS